MVRWAPVRAGYRRFWAIGLVVAGGCAHSHSALSDRLASRIVPAGVGTDTSATPAQAKTADRRTSEPEVQLASVSQPGQGAQTRTENGASVALPAAIERDPGPIGADRSALAEPRLPPDSDEAALDSIAANGKPMTLPEAISLAFANQPRLRAQLETIRQARGQEQIAFSAFLPLVSGAYSVGGYGVGVGGNEVRISPQSPNFNFVPFLGFAPVGLHASTEYELAELKVQWLLLDFGRRLGRYQQARLANDIAVLQTDRAFQTVANDVAVSYYNVLRSQALRRTAKDALRRALEELADSRKREREGVVERETVLRSEVQLSETRQLFHSATETEFVTLAALNLAIGLKSEQALRLVERSEVPPLNLSLADCLETAVRERREFNVIRNTVEVAVQGTRIARADFAPKVVADGSLWHFRQQNLNDNMDLRLGFIRLEWVLFEGGRRIAAAHVAESQVRQAMAHAESIVDNIAFQVNEAYRNAVTSWVGIEDARPAVHQASENYRLVQLRLREGAAIPSEIADAQASLTRSEQNYLNARYNYLIALDRLQFAMGISQTPSDHSATHH